MALQAPRRKLWAMSAFAPRIWRIGRAMAAACSACNASTNRARRSPFRMDDRKQRIIVDADGGEGMGFFGWEAADAGALDALAATPRQPRRQGRARRPRACRRAPRADLIVLNDPLGNRLEIFHGAEVATEPFRPGRSISGFRTGPLGLGHVVLNVDTAATIDRLMAFYRDTLGFRLTDYYSAAVCRSLSSSQSAPSQPCLHPDRQERRPSHHDGAVSASTMSARATIIALGEEGRVRVTLGRHTSDFITSFYSLDAVGLHGRIRLGRAFDRRRHLAGLRAQRGSRACGATTAPGCRRRTRQSPRAAPEECRGRLSPPGAGDGRQLRGHVRRLSVVGQRQGAIGWRAMPSVPMRNGSPQAGDRRTIPHPPRSPNSSRA